MKKKAKAKTESDIKTKPKKIPRKKSKVKTGPVNSIASEVVKGFFRTNLIWFAGLIVAYVILYLFLLVNPSLYHDFFKGILHDLFGTKGESFFFSNSYLLMIPVYLCILAVNSFVYSIKTLYLLNITYKSLDFITNEDTEVSTFPKEYSDIEIKLRDIKLEVLESRQALLESESKKDDLVMYLAHDLKTPLTSVIGYLTLLDESPEIPDSQKAKFTDIALNKAYRLEQLITEFFEITRFNIHSITLANNRINLGMMMAQIADEFYPMLSEKGLSVDIDIPEPIIMFADSDKIARVFDNLLKNAVNYSYDNTLIRIGARIRRDRVVIKFRNKSDEIPEEKLQRLFDKFYRVDSSRGSQSGGSGLGLAIAKQIVELHGGTIRAKSTPDYTDFTVILPYRSAEEITDEQLEF